MLELYWAVEALAGIEDDQSRIERNQELILERLEELKSQLKELGQKVDEQIMVDSRTGMQHLLAGYNSHPATEYSHLILPNFSTPSAAPQMNSIRESRTCSGPGEMSIE